MTSKKETHRDYEVEPLLSNPLGKLGDDHNLSSGNNQDRRDRSLYRNFLLMCIAFSVNHGCVVSCLAYATTMLGDKLGGYGSGCLYVFYALTAFLLSKPTVMMVGPKNGLLLGVCGYCIYVGGFLFAIIVPAIAPPVFLLAACIGGIAGGLLWPSQGRYFARNAKLYSEASDIPVEKINSVFAGIFATSYLGLETVTKVLATILFLVFPDSASYIIFTLYAILALLACVVILSLSDLEERGTWDFSYESIMVNALSSSKVIMEDIRLALMLPFQIAFGFCSSFVPYYVFGTVIAGSSKLGGTYVGLLSAIIVLTGAAMALPAAWAANVFGKGIVMVGGGLCLAFAGFVFFFLSDAVLGTWIIIIPYLIIYGVGRGTWENTNKAVIADLFTNSPELSTSGFAAISFSNGFAGAIGYFTFSSISRNAMATTVFVSSIIAITCFLISSYIARQQTNSLNKDQNSALYRKI
eukprot:gene5980-8236_t